MESVREWEGLFDPPHVQIADNNTVKFKWFKSEHYSKT